jgi:hypothetical protein
MVQPRVALVRAVQQQELDVTDRDPGAGHPGQGLLQHRRPRLQVVGPLAGSDGADAGTDEVEAGLRGDGHQLGRGGVEE